MTIRQLPHYARVLTSVRDDIWAIVPEKLIAIRTLLALRAQGQTIDPEEIREVAGSQRHLGDLRIPDGMVSLPTTSEGSETASYLGLAEAGVGGSGGGVVAVIPVFGTIAKRTSMLTESSGGTSTDRVEAAFQQAIVDPGIGAVILDIDSPGGSVSGVQELWDTIFEVRGQKPVVAVADTLAASAAYWIATAADEIVVSTSSEVGSIGVLTVHEDLSKRLEQEGVDATIISAGRYKAEANPFEPLSDEAREAIQGRVNDHYQMFVSSVAKGRGVGVGMIRDGFGQGRLVGAREAVVEGMADVVGTLDETIRRLLPRRGRRGASSKVLRDRLAMATD